MSEQVLEKPTDSTTTELTAQNGDVKTEPTGQQVEPVENPEGVLKKNRELLDELKKTKTILAKYEAEQQKIKEAELLKQGEFQKLLEEKQSQIDELTPHLEKSQKYDDYFTKQLAKELEGLSDIEQSLINNLGVSTDEKLSYALELKDSKHKSVNSPGSARPGNPDMKSFNLDDYTGKDAGIKLIKLKKSDPVLYQKIIEAKKLNM